MAVLGVLGWRIAAPLPLAAFCWAAVIGVALAYVDLAVHRLPNGLVFTAFAGTLVLLTATAGIGWDVWRLVVAVMCSIGVAALYLLLALLPRGFGLGDVKLGLLVGLAAGWYGPRAAITATVTALILAGFVALALSLRRSAPANIPHGPFMLAGLILSLVTLGS